MAAAAVPVLSLHHQTTPSISLPLPDVAANLRSGRLHAAGDGRSRHPKTTPGAIPNSDCGFQGAERRKALSVLVRAKRKVGRVCKAEEFWERKR